VAQSGAGAASTLALYLIELLEPVICLQSNSHGEFGAFAHRGKT
jgi:hypothetical protein